MMAPVTLQAVNVVKEFGPRSARHRALDGVSLSVTEGQRIGIVGESGSGKSTISRIMVGLNTATSGSVEYAGLPISAVLRSRTRRLEFRRDVQYIAQDTSSSFDPRRTLLDAVVAPLRNLRGLDKREAERTALDTIVRLELDPSLAYRYPSQVSGGQRQRFALALGLVVRPRILLCDEVVSALDVSVQGAILNLIKSYCLESGAGLVFVSHGLPATAFIADELIVMNKGKIVEAGKSGEVLAAPADPYTAKLVRAHTGRAA
ncbi:MAG: dipeptide/oligopeptide/nickel ABC transporter ATP-binding protein [Gordonia sp. (in: high G+C Gram-positive bacteria)]